MKYLKTKNSRRRGAAIELAIGLLLIMTAMSTIIVATTMIQLNKQKQSIHDLNNVISEYEKMEYDQIGRYFESLIENEYNSIVDLTELPMENNLVPGYEDELKSNLEANLSTKYSRFMTEKDLTFVVEVNLEFTPSAPISLPKIKENDTIITISKKTYDYVITFLLTIKKGNTYKVDVFNSKYTITCQKEETTTLLQHTKEIEKYMYRYFWLSDLSDTLDIDDYLFGMKCDNNFLFEINSDLSYEFFIEVLQDPNEEVSYSMSINDSIVNIYFNETSEDKEYIIKLSYKDFVVPSTPEDDGELVNEGGNDEGAEGETPEETPNEYTELYFKIFVKGTNIESEPSEVDEEVLEEPENKEPATEDNYEIKIHIFNGYETVLDDTKEDQFNIDYKLMYKKLEKNIWTTK